MNILRDMAGWVIVLIIIPAGVILYIGWLLERMLEVLS